ncbi:hypothetical protein, partial [Candidatus Propionivibrio aalborgensis]|uniref:hypothetical protein n=1 Tax=Candidatus Propionivibrio aalborgensis TaxID=1860101 RepID=UPI001C911917
RYAPSCVSDSMRHPIRPASSSTKNRAVWPATVVSQIKCGSIRLPAAIIPIEVKTSRSSIAKTFTSGGVLLFFSGDVKYHFVSTMDSCARRIANSTNPRATADPASCTRNVTVATLGFRPAFSLFPPLTMMLLLLIYVAQFNYSYLFE